MTSNHASRSPLANYAAHLGLLVAIAIGGCVRTDYSISRPMAAPAPTPQSATSSPTATTIAANTEPSAAEMMRHAAAQSSHGHTADPQCEQAALRTLRTEPSDSASTSASTLADGLESLTQATFAGQGSDFDPRLSRDGKVLVFSSTQHRATADIYTKVVGSRSVTQLTLDPGNDVMPALSPDGQRIAFCSDRAGSWNLYVMSARGGQAVQITTEKTADLHPSWSPDGSRLVFCRLGQNSGRWELWVVSVSQPTSAEFIGYGMLPEWCPVAGTGAGNTDRILFQRGRERGDRAFSLWTIDYKPGNAGNPTEIVASRAAAAINPTWSPDGKWIAYTGLKSDASWSPDQPSTRSAPADIWITGVEGGGTVNLTAGRYTNLMPHWGADGRIYFVSDRGGSENIWSVGTEKALAAASSGGESPSASANKNEAPLANVPNP